MMLVVSEGAAAGDLWTAAGSWRCVVTVMLCVWGGGDLGGMPNLGLVCGSWVR
jgi:hypothetical protein